MKQVNSHTLRFTFKKRAIGNPTRYGIAFVEEEPMDGQLVFFDRAPNTGFLVHRLR